MRRLWLLGVGGPAVLMGSLVVLAVALGGLGTVSPSGKALADIPPGYLSLYASAAASCPGLPWTVLAAIGTVESSNGRSTAPGVQSGANFAGAEGPMQFLPATFAAYAVAGPGGSLPPSPYDPTDAVYTAARMLCADGGGRPGGLAGAVFAYNHSVAYVHQVLSLASSYAGAPAAGSAPGAAGAAVAYALSKVGTPYLWGGEGPNGFDCSGLVQAAYAVAGVSLPRVAQAQFDAGPPVPAGQALEPGDLVFFGASENQVTHVGIYLGNQTMVDAPHSGASVRVEPSDWRDYLGATRPG